MFLFCCYFTLKYRMVTISFFTLSFLFLSDDRFSRICKLESDGKPTCSACQTGYTGRNCER